LVKIRLKRGGTRKKPFYRIVATDNRNARDGANLEILGYYHPRITENEKQLKKFEFDEEKLLKWYKNGAQVSNTVLRLIKEAGLEEKLTRK
jgi:small subunit ribosomal protein S16